MPRNGNRSRSRWTRKAAQGKEGLPPIQHSSPGRVPAEPADLVAIERADMLGPYETKYDVLHGYGSDRTIIQP